MARLSVDMHVQVVPLTDAEHHECTEAGHDPNCYLMVQEFVTEVALTAGAEEPRFRPEGVMRVEVHE